jgi:putative sterol carrier protein
MVSLARERRMAEAVHEFFSTLGSRLNPDALDGMSGSYAFDIAGAGQWTVRIGGRGLSVTEGIGDADVRIETSPELLEAIVAGERNATIAYLTGKLKLEGDVEAALGFQRLFD